MPNVSVNSPKKKERKKGLFLAGNSSESWSHSSTLLLTLFYFLLEVFRNVFKSQNIDSVLFPAKWQRQGSRWTAAQMCDLWLELFGGAGLLHALNSPALCMAITWERSLAFQLHTGCMAVFHIINGWSFSPSNGMINSLWCRQKPSRHVESNDSIMFFTP